MHSIETIFPNALFVFSVQQKIKTNRSPLGSPMLLDPIRMGVPVFHGRTTAKLVCMVRARHGGARDLIASMETTAVFPRTGA